MDSYHNHTSPYEEFESADWLARPLCDSDDNDPNDDNEKNPLKEKLRDWVLTHNISHNAVSDLLKILNDSNPSLPKAARTLLQTEGTIEI